MNKEKVISESESELSNLLATYTKETFTKKWFGPLGLRPNKN